MGGRGIRSRGPSGRRVRPSGRAGLRAVQWALLLCTLWGLVIAGASAAHAERRVALVIGNASYNGMPALQNPRNDANDVAAALRDLGFEVMVSTDMKRADVRDVLAKFSSMAAGADTALVYYAGHALEVRGQYYLVPVDATIEAGSNLRYVMMPVADLRDVISGAKGLRVMIFDACRNDPIEGAANLTPEAARAARREEVQKALAGAEGGKGMVVAYATAPFDVAEDGKARNSPFTATLLKWLKEPGIEIRSLFRKVSSEVYADTGGRQMPEITLAMQGDYFFNGSDSHDAVWLRIRHSSDPADFRDFLARFPLSIHAPSASRRLDMLERSRREAQRRAREEQEMREAERRRALCAKEAAEVESLRQAGRREDLLRLKAAAACPKDTAARVDAALAVLAAQEAKRAKEAQDAQAAAQAAAQEAEQRRRREEAEVARRAELDRQRLEQEAQAQAQAQALAQRQRDEAEAARKAELERKRLEQEAELGRQKEAAALDRQRQEKEAAERQRRAACELEAGRITAAAAGAAPKDALSALLKGLTCPENAALVAKAYAAVDEAARAACAREADQYARTDRADAAALSAFAGRVQCPEVAVAVRAQVQHLQAEREQAAQACARDMQEMDRLRRLGSEGRDQLERLGTVSTCPTIKPQVVAALGALTPLPQQNTREQVRRGAAALRRIGCLAEAGDLPIEAVRKGLARYFAARRVEPVSLDIGDDLLRRLDGEGDQRVCPLTCTGDEVERDGKCVPARPSAGSPTPAKPAAKPATAPSDSPPNAKPPQAKPQQAKPPQAEAPRQEQAPKPAPPVASSAPPKRTPSIILGN